MGVWQSYRLGMRRRRYRLRALRKRREMRAVSDRTGAIAPGNILLVSTLRNEFVRLRYFLDYYRALGVDHFLMIDNGSTDGSAAYLADQPDVSLWTTQASYRKSRFGVDWTNWIAWRYAHGHWTLSVDVDEFFVYPFCDTRPLRALTDWLDTSSTRTFGAMLLDMYPKGRITDQVYREGQDPLEMAPWFDAGNYTITKNSVFGNAWIQGGPRARLFFADRPAKAPALNKIPLVRWQRTFVYVSSTHMMLPRSLNAFFDEWGGEKPCGCLLHAKFLDTFAVKSAEELKRKQHYANSHEYRAYAELLKSEPDLWCKWSERYINWRQLEILGLMSKGNWA